MVVEKAFRRTSTRNNRGRLLELLGYRLQEGASRDDVYVRSLH